MKAIFVTDIHGRLEWLERLPPADLLLAGGDITPFGPLTALDGFLARARARYPAILAVSGNCDPPEAAAILQRADVGIEFVWRDSEGVRFFGIGGSNRTPCNTPNEWEDAACQAALATQDTKAPALTPPGRRVLLTHAPPYGSLRDVAVRP